MSGRELIDTMETLAQSYATIRRIVLALIQERDGSGAADADYLTPATIFGFVDATDALSPATAHSAFLELDSMIQAIGPALEQACSRFKQ